MVLAIVRPLVFAGVLLTAMLPRTLVELRAQAPVEAVSPPARPLRTTPTVAWERTLGFRDWGAAVRAGDLVIAGNITGKGGLFAIDEATGTLRWRVDGARVSTTPVSDGRTVVVAARHAELLAAYTVAGGKAAWQKPMRFVRDTVIARAADVVLALHADEGALYAIDMATGRTHWKTQVTPTYWHCGAGPVVAGETVYVASGLQSPANSKTDFFLHAIDLKTGQERWRYNPPPEYPNRGVCLEAIVVAGDTVVATGDGYLYGVDRQTGAQAYRAEVGDETRRSDVFDLVAAGPYVFGATEGALSAFEPRTGRVAWRVPGRYAKGVTALAAADGVLYFQGQVAGVDPEATGRHGILHALDISTRAVLWSFTRATDESWNFANPLPVDGGLYVDTYRTLLKLK
jgi:outer membrane protein assembly factor BamB